MQRLISSILFAAFAFLTLSAEDCGTQHFIDDSGFDLWCDEQLCAWEVEAGQVVQAPSWHKDDYAAEFVGDSVVISQLSVGARTTCLRFEVLADIDDNARVFLEMDFFDDGVLDYEEELGHVTWERLTYFVGTRANWDSVRFTLRKEGPGRARLAQIEATNAADCVGDPLEVEDHN